MTQLTAMVLQDTPRRVNELRTDVPPGLAHVIARCLEKDPAMRYTSVADLARELEPFGSQRGVSLRIALVGVSRGVVPNPRSTGKVAPAGGTSVAWEDTQLSPPPRRHRALAVMGEVALLVVVAGGGSRGRLPRRGTHRRRRNLRARRDADGAADRSRGGRPIESPPAVLPPRSPLLRPLPQSRRRRAPSKPPAPSAASAAATLGALGFPRLATPKPHSPSRKAYAGKPKAGERGERGERGATRSGATTSPMSGTDRSSSPIWVSEPSSTARAGPGVGSLLHEGELFCRLPIASLSLGTLAPGRAFAQDASSQAAAQALFEQARQLMAQGKYAEACPKLVESQKLDPGAGTLLNLGACYEKNGQTASAWVTFKDNAAAAADLKHRADWSTRARERAQELEKSLSKLTIEVPPDARVSGLQVRRDGVEVGAAVWGTPIPIDPGDHTIEASCTGEEDLEQDDEDRRRCRAGARAWSRRCWTSPGPSAAKQLGRVDAGHPRWSALSLPHPPPSTPPPAQSDRSTQRTLGLVIGGVGIVGVAVGSVFGASLAMGSESELEEPLPD